MLRADLLDELTGFPIVTCLPTTTYHSTANHSQIVRLYARQFYDMDTFYQPCAQAQLSRRQS